MDIPMPDRAAPGHLGCVTNFDHEGQRLTVWNTGTIYRLTEFGCGGAELPLTHDPLFQSLAGELLRFGAEIGRSRRREMEAAQRERKLREAATGLCDALDTGTDPRRAFIALRALLKEDK